MDGGFTLFKYADTEVELSTLPQASVESDEYKAFVSDRILSPNEPFGEATDGKKPKKLDINKVDEDTARGIHEARGQEWGKYQQYNAAVPIMGPMLEGLLREGHVPIPSQSVDVDKNEFKKGRSDYEPKYRSRLVSCGNCEGVSRNELTCDAPTVDAETHCLIASYAASRKLKLRCGDISSAYFQSEPLERVIIMKQPRGGLPGVPPEAMLLRRLPVYGTMDAGRGLYVRLCKVWCEEGLKIK